MKVPTADIRVLMMVVVALAAGCRLNRSSPAHLAPGQFDSAAAFEAGVRYASTKTAGWRLRVDPRSLDSIATTFDVQRDAAAAPAPSVLANDSLLVAQRRAVLTRLGIPQVRIDEYAACTRYLGGVPYTGPEPRDRETATDRERSRACASLRADAAAIFSSPRQQPPDGSGMNAWSMRVYLLTPTSREVSDLLMVRESDGRSFRITRAVEHLKVISKARLPAEWDPVGSSGTSRT